MTGTPPTSPASAERITEDAGVFAARLGARDRLLGLDLGTKTIGLALSDATRMIASPFETLTRGRLGDDAARLVAIIAEQGVGGLVVGLPRNMDGSTGPRAQSSRAFARNIGRFTPIPVLLWDERLTTAEAERLLIAADSSRRRRAEVIDKLAATLILQGALDRMRADRGDL